MDMKKKKSLMLLLMVALLSMVFVGCANSGETNKFFS